MKNQHPRAQQDIRFTRRAFSIASIAALAPKISRAQDVGRVVVPFPPGGPADVLARLLVDQGLGSSISKRYIVENRPGAGGTLGTSAVAKAPADGSMLLFVATSFVQSAALYEKPGYDPIKDFASVAQAGTTFVALCVRSDNPAKNFGEFVQTAKASPASYASAGNGSPTHLYGSLLVAATGIQATHVPYKGEAPGLADFLGGQVDFGFFAPVTVRQYVASGRVRVLGVTGPRRSNIFPDAPTMNELGITGLDVLGWFGLFAPTRTPPQLISGLANDALHAAGAPAVQNWMSINMIERSTLSPPQFAKTVENDFAKWQRMIRTANVTLN